jgi:hypothetical protein
MLPVGSKVQEGGFTGPPGLVKLRPEMGGKSHDMLRREPLISDLVKNQVGYFRGPNPLIQTFEIER